MTRPAALRVGMWDELIDRDIERLLRGDSVHNADMMELEGFVRSVRRLRDATPSNDVIEGWVATSVAAVSMPPAPPTRSKRPSHVFGLRRRLASLAASVWAVVGLAGVALAADDAVPGDWLYPIDVAFELVGVGAGGEIEREAERQALAIEPASPLEPVAPSRADVSGLENAADKVALGTVGSERSVEVHAGVSSLLAYFAENPNKDRTTMFELVNGFAKGDDHGNGPGTEGGDTGAKPVGVGKPEDVGKPENPGSGLNRGNAPGQNNGP